MRRSNELNWRFHIAVISQARDILRPAEQAGQTASTDCFYSAEARVAIEECLASIEALKAILADQGFILDVDTREPRRA